jgi:two-component system chemotaxis response regulator CheY
MGTQQLEKAMEGLVVLIADSNPYTRRLTRMMLTNLGIKSTYESQDGAAALETIRSVNPDVMIMDWDMPVLDGPEVMRIVRSPGVYPKANLPIIMLSDNGLQSRVTAALRLGVHEFLVKPISPKTLQQRLLGLILNPRPMVQAGQFYIPTPRRRGDVNELIELPDAPPSADPEQTRAELPLPGDLSRLPGQLQNVHAGVGAVDDIHVAPVVGL